MIGNFLVIMQNIILPVFIIILIGVILQRKFSLDLNTLAKLNLYFFVPGIIFVKLYEADYSGNMDLLFWVILFNVIFLSIILAIGWITAAFMPLSREGKTVMSNSIAFYNSGNYGLPVNSLAFKNDPFAMSVQIIVLLMQNLLTFTYGVFLMRSIKGSKLQALLGYFKMPLFYAIVVAVFLNVMDWKLPAPIWTSAQFISDGLIAVALVTLGAQVANLNLRFIEWKIWLSVVLRLVVGPAIGLVIILLLGIDGVIAQALFISTAMPTSVNSAIIAQEYDNEPEFAARIVLLSTIMSAFTVTAVIYLAQQLF